jgi:hypothetical protein
LVSTTFHAESLHVGDGLAAFLNSTRVVCVVSSFELGLIWFYAKETVSYQEFNCFGVQKSRYLHLRTRSYTLRTSLETYLSLGLSISPLIWSIDRNVLNLIQKK